MGPKTGDEPLDPDDADVGTAVDPVGVRPDRFATARLVLRPWRHADAQRLLAIRGRPEVSKWLSDPEPWSGVGVAIEHIDRWNRSRWPLGTWAIVPKATGVPAGSVSLRPLPDTDEIEIGWYLHPDCQGRGYAREAAGAALRHALANRVRSVWAVMWPHNEASARLAAAIGMTDLGVRFDPWYGTSDDPDSRLFRLSPTDESARLEPADCEG